MFSSLLGSKWRGISTFEEQFILSEDIKDITLCLSASLQHFFPILQTTEKVIGISFGLVKHEHLTTRFEILFCILF